MQFQQDLLMPCTGYLLRLNMHDLGKLKVASGFVASCRYFWQPSVIFGRCQNVCSTI